MEEGTIVECLLNDDADEDWIWCMRHINEPKREPAPNKAEMKGWLPVAWLEPVYTLWSMETADRDAVLTHPG